MASAVAELPNVGRAARDAGPYGPDTRFQFQQASEEAAVLFVRRGIGHVVANLSNVMEALGG